MLITRSFTFIWARFVKMKFRVQGCMEGNSKFYFEATKCPYSMHLCSAKHQVRRNEKKTACLVSSNFNVGKALKLFFQTDVWSLPNGRVKQEWFYSSLPEWCSVESDAVQSPTPRLTSYELSHGKIDICGRARDVSGAVWTSKWS